LSILKKTQTEKTQFFQKLSQIFQKKLPNFLRNSMYWNILLYKLNKKLIFSRKNSKNVSKTQCTGTQVVVYKNQVVLKKKSLV